MLFSSVVLSHVSSSEKNSAASGAVHSHASISSPKQNIRNTVLTKRSADCAEYVSVTYASVEDEQRRKSFQSHLTITAEGNHCLFHSNNIPNHNFNDRTAHFAHSVEEIAQQFTLNRYPIYREHTVPLSQQWLNGIMLNGVVIDLMSAGCYQPNAPMADREGNVSAGCRGNAKWVLEPLGSIHKFGSDAHNAHTQPGGMYHYHGNPKALFNDQPGAKGSPVIGFAADGFPIYGSYFFDGQTVRKARSSYQLKQGYRPGRNGTDPGGNYDGTYIADYAFKEGSGDLDKCNGMRINGQYGYYVTDTYPWILNCFRGQPHLSFQKKPLSSNPSSSNPSMGHPPREHPGQREQRGGRHPPPHHRRPPP
ncbi:YHYH protein [Marinibactrum halimedae]|uniref:YHYH domain-containing protein n=1 Tax=Marinibactrum halimedae TaxID=1444977 RepID=A0AA37T950_9GAMM|nr:YHYH protein [Marinibactrum halimedae]MCD9457685.1 YHYH protein [Marinibactrum halimedae]GLS24942.1 hypothetical protein GCM10007877_06560 [Marinibactrum halimedae]